MLFFKKETKHFSDEQLMQMQANGNKNAFETLYKRYHQKMFWFFSKSLNDSIKAEDFTQDLFIKIIENPSNFDPSKKFSSWIYTVAINMCKNEWRNLENRAKNHEIIKSVENQFIAANADKMMDYKLFKKHLDLVYKEFDINNQLLYNLRFQQELSLKEIAEILNIPEGTVKSRLFNLVHSLSEKFKIFNHSFKL